MKLETAALALMLVILGAPLALPQSSVTANISVAITTVIHIGLDNTALNWENITKPSTYTWYRHIHQPNNDENIQLTIYSDTTVRVDISANRVKPSITGSGDTAMEVRIYNGDNLLQYIGDSDTVDATWPLSVPWLQDLGPPAGTNLTYNNIAPALGVNNNQYGGTYSNGSLTISAAEG